MAGLELFMSSMLFPILRLGSSPAYYYSLSTFDLRAIVVKINKFNKKS